MKENARNEGTRQTTGPNYPYLRTALADTTRGRDPEKLRICIATPDIAGPVRTGGIGTAYRNLGLALAEAGHEVSILFTLGEYSENGSLARWISNYRKAGVSLVPVPRPVPDNRRAPLACQKAYTAYEWLRRQAFDLIHLPEWQGHGYYALLAKRLGLAFEQTVFCVGAHSPSSWNAAGNSIQILDTQPLMLDFMERRSVEWADYVISPTRYMLNWMRAEDWKLPEGRCFVQPNMPEPDIGASRRPVGQTREGIDEIVFFGRLEWRKGLHIFCDAVSQLNARPVADIRVTFLGKPLDGAFRSLDYISDRMKGLRFPWKTITNLDSDAAREYLRGGRRLAVVPSLVDNAPMGILECVNSEIPFVACRAGGVEEMVSIEDQSHVLAPPLPKPLADKLEEALLNGAHTARHAINLNDNRRTWLQWHDELAVQLSTPRHDGRHNPTEATAVRDRPRVTVCVIHYNRAWALEQAIESLKRQTYRNFDVVVVDDGSTDAETVDAMVEIEADLVRRGWKLIRQSNQYAGAARNTAARNATGEYLLFMDDDNLAKRDEIERFVEVATRTQADILTCFGDIFSGAEPPLEGATALRRALFLGDCAAVGLFYNMFGDANFLVKKERFHSIGGFTEDYGVGLEDQEFFARAVMTGAVLYVVPEALYWYREDGGNGIKSRHYSRESADWRVLKPYLAAAPSHMRLTLALVQGLFVSQARRKTDVQTANAPATISREDHQRLLKSIKEASVGGDVSGKIRDILEPHARLRRFGRTAFNRQLQMFLYLTKLEARIAHWIVTACRAVSSWRSKPEA